jgi:hypothetical protein
MDIQITVADIIYPAPGKKQGKIIDHTGKEWQVWGDKMAGYNRGNSYVVQKYKTSDFKGKTYYTIEDVMPVQGGPAPQPRPIPNEPVRMVPSSGPISDTERRMDIFVCGAFNNLMANPNVNPAMLQAADMIEFVKRLKATWVNTLGPNRPGTAARAAQNADMNDELPEGF